MENKPHWHDCTDLLVVDGAISSRFVGFKGSFEVHENLEENLALPKGYLFYRPVKKDDNNA